jgi:Zn-dependent peptidase ImmA (M78 family)
LRTKGAYGSNPFNYYRNIIERNGIIVAQISGVAMEEMKGISIYFDSYPIIGINNKDYDKSKVFSLFHELAHIFRRSSSLCTIDLDEHSDQEETICDRIAAEALMPEIRSNELQMNALCVFPRLIQFALTE